MANRLKIKILGTGTSQGVPVIGCTCTVCLSADARDTRLRTSVSVQSDKTHVVVDAGPDFRQQMLGAGFTNLDAILLTHEHNDHVNGLDEVRPINFIHKKDIPVYALPRVLNEVRKRFPYAFDELENYPGRPRIELNEIGLEPFTLGDLQIQPIEVHHGKLDILGFRFGKFAYITDAKNIDEDQVALLADLDLLVINALHRRNHFSHMNLHEAVEMIGRIAPAHALITHISHSMGLHTEVEMTLPRHIRLAFDGFETVIG